MRQEYDWNWFNFRFFTWNDMYVIFFNPNNRWWLQTIHIFRTFPERAPIFSFNPISQCFPAAEWHYGCSVDLLNSNMAPFHRYSSFVQLHTETLVESVVHNEIERTNCQQNETRNYIFRIIVIISHWNRGNSNVLESVLSKSICKFSIFVVNSIEIVAFK